MEEAFEGEPALKSLEARDRAFVRMLVATVLRRLGQIDAILTRSSWTGCGRQGPGRCRTCCGWARPAAASSDTPAHAAVDTSVELAAEGAETGGFKALVNAVLRRIGREKNELLKATAAPALNTPAWLWDSWVKAYGETRARGIALAHLADPPLDFSVKADPERWAQQLGATILPTGSLRRTDGGSIEALPGFADGAWWIQDAAAALPVTLLGRSPARPSSIFAPHPAARPRNWPPRGATVTAVDRSAKRLERLTANLARLGLTAETVTADATDMAAGGTGRRGAAGCALLRHRHHPPPPRCRLAENP